MKSLDTQYSGFAKKGRKETIVLCATRGSHREGRDVLALRGKDVMSGLSEGWARGRGS